MQNRHLPINPRRCSVSHEAPAASCLSPSFSLLLSRSSSFSPIRHNRTRAGTRDHCTVRGRRTVYNNALPSRDLDERGERTDVMHCVTITVNRCDETRRDATRDFLGRPGRLLVVVLHHVEARASDVTPFRVCTCGHLLPNSGRRVYIARPRGREGRRRARQERNVR